MVWFDPPSNPGSTVIMHRQPDDIWRIDYQLAPDDDVEAETTESAIRARIANHLGWLASTDQHGEKPWTLEWHGFYKAHALALDDFRHRRVVFAGDAAHLVPIFGVRGLNSGMEDADTLAWTLAAVVAGDAGAELLDVYAAERHHAWQQNVDNAGKSTLIMTPGSDGFRATRDALLDLAKVRPEFAHLIDPRQSSATHAHGSPLNLPAAEGTAGLLPGDPLEDRAVTTAGGKETSLHDLRGAGFGLYAVAPAEADLLLLERLGDELRAAYSREQVTAVAVGTAEELPESDHLVVLPDDHGTAAAWEAAPGEVVVVRPDGLVLARGRAADLAGRLGGDHAADRSDPTTLVPVRLTPEQAARERVWLSLSEALDAAAPEQRAPLLTRLALALGDAVGPDHLDRVLADVAAAH
jgi:3-(3-hydroxy-phenyl)propionate hydroxylase